MRRMIFFVFALLIFAPPKPALTGETGREAEVRAAVTAFGKAFVEADVPALEAFLTSNYVHVNGSSGNLLGREDWLGWVKSRRVELDLGDLVVSDYLIDDVKVELCGDSAVVTGLVHSRGTRHGIPFSSLVRFSNFWVFQEGAWRRAAFHDSIVPGS